MNSNASSPLLGRRQDDAPGSPVGPEDVAAAESSALHHSSYGSMGSAVSSSGGAAARAWGPGVFVRPDQQLRRRAGAMSSDDAHYLGMEERREKLSSLFGVRPWAGAVSREASEEKHQRRFDLYEFKEPGASDRAEQLSGDVEDGAESEEGGQRAAVAVGAATRASRRRSPRPGLQPPLTVTASNLAWTLLLGWVMGLAYLLTALLAAATVVCLPHARVALSMAAYYLFPFGKYVMEAEVDPEPSAHRTSGGDHGRQPAAVSNPVLVPGQESDGAVEATVSLNGGGKDGDSPTCPSPSTRRQADEGESSSSLAANHASYTSFSVHARHQFQPSGRAQRGSWPVYLVWLVCCAPLYAVHAVAFLLCWCLIVAIPMAKVSREGLFLLLRKPLLLRVSAGPPRRLRVLLCTHQAINVGYIKYSVFDGFNVCMVNMSVLSVPVVIMGLGPLIIPSMWSPPPYVLFLMALVTMIPLAYYIGMAIGRISAQSTPAVGAVLNATFGSIVDIILFCSAIAKGGLDQLVKSAVIGSLLMCLLLFPGASMVAGGIKYKVQQLNYLSAGVSALLLFISVVGAFTPTVFYQTYGRYELLCFNCTESARPSVGGVPAPSLLWTSPLDAGAVLSRPMDCTACHMEQVHPRDDPRYVDSVRPLMFVCASLLPVGYIVGLIFTLKTHAAVIYEESTSSGHEQGTAQWSRAKCATILVVASVVFGLVAEVLVESIQPTLERFGVSQDFIGLTVIALVPSVTELINSLKFALQDNMALALEVGLSYSVQLVMIQIPVLVFFSAAIGSDGFTLVFRTLDVFTVFFAVLILNYVTFSPRTNYFEGVCLLIVYTIIISAFGFAPAESFEPHV